jgi:Core-2/I-Branching enzyme
MKIAVLVLAHRYPIGLRALTRFFSAPCFEIFVHVDRKIDEAPFVENAGRSASFLQDRIPVFWRGGSIVEATMRLLIYARSRGEFDRYVLLSDDSVAIVDAKTVLRSLETFPDHIHIHLARQRAWRYDKFYMYDSEATQLRWTPDREVTEDALHRLERLAALRRRGKKPLSEYYQGSQWWALSAQSVDRVIASWNEDEWLRESFEFSDAPDEGYFQTVLAATCLQRSRSFMWVDWTTPTPPPPRIFRTCDELAEIRPSTELFARKIDLESAALDSWMARLI